MKRIFKASAIAAIALAALVVSPLARVEVKAANTYINNPVLNSRAMEDIVVDESAVYGFRPDPNSDRLGSYADADWTDPEKVAEWQKERIAYHNDFTQMYKIWKDMEAQGKSVEEIARTVSAQRNEIRFASYNGDAERIAILKQSNLTKYGNENGPTPEYLFAKYGSWEKVLIKSFSENPGMDACLGLYDIYYGYYPMVGELVESYEQSYTTKAGDSLSKIAEKYYGDSTKWVKVYEANKDVVKDPNVIFVGQDLKINLQ